MEIGYRFHLWICKICITHGVCSCLFNVLAEEPKHLQQQFDGDVNFLTSRCFRTRLEQFKYQLLPSDLH